MTSQKSSDNVKTLAGCSVLHPAIVSTLFEEFRDVTSLTPSPCSGGSSGVEHHSIDLGETPSDEGIGMGGGFPLSLVGVWGT